jgi:hypothetical protein
MRALFTTYILGMYELAIFESHMVGKIYQTSRRIRQSDETTSVYTNPCSPFFVMLGGYARNCGTVRFRYSRSSSRIVDLAISAIRFA